MRIFISYAHVDKAIVKDWIVDKLAAGGHDVWFDDRLIAGQSWKKQLGEEIAQSDALLYAMTPESLMSDWCQWELSTAVRLGKSVIPVLLQQRTKLPDNLRELQYVDFSNGPTGDAVARLMGGLQKVSPAHFSANRDDSSQTTLGNAHKLETEATKMDEDTKKPKTRGNIQAENYITGGKFGPGSAFGSKSRVEANTIVETINQASSGIDAQQLETFLTLLDKLKTEIAETPSTLDEYQGKDLQRSLEVVEDHARRPDHARDISLLMQSLNKIRTILVGVVPIAELANKLWNFGQKIFGK